MYLKLFPGLTDGVPFPVLDRWGRVPPWYDGPNPLPGAQLSGLDMHWLDLTNAELNGADLSHAFLGDSLLTGANLSGARLFLNTMEGAFFMGVDLSNTDLNTWFDTYAYYDERTIFPADYDPIAFG